jgi:hypothetical protein
MNTEKQALQRVQGALYHLRRGLAPFVEARMKAKHGAQWQVYASRAAGGDPRAALDEYGLLKTMIDQWRDAFDEAFSRAEKHRVRNFVSTALEARNATSHLSIPLQDDEALRYLDAIHQVLRAVKAPEAEVAETRRLYDEQRRSGLMTTPTPTQPVAPAPEAALEKPSKQLRPWIEVAFPHPDVLENRFKEAEFAADLFAVESGNAEGDYATPRGFFGITFLTEGLKRVLLSTAQRLAGQGGDPVIGLQTAFGGGKTHTLLAVYHLARHLAEGGDPASLPGLQPLLASFGPVSWPKPRLAAFVGSAKGADVSLTLKDGPKLRTLWGYLAWRVAGDAGLTLVAEAEAARTSPGSELMVEVFRLAGPSVILLDELVMFARQLEDIRFEAFLSFIQSLTEAAKLVPGILIVGSLPESDSEAGGARGSEAVVAAGEGIRAGAVGLAAGVGRRDLRDHPPTAVPDARRRRRAGARGDGQGVRRHVPSQSGRVPASGQGGALRRAAAAFLSDPSRAVRPALPGLGQPRQISAHPRRAAVHGKCPRRAVAGAVGRSADPACPRADRERPRARQRALSAGPAIRRRPRQGGRWRRLAAGPNGAEPDPTH